MLEFRRDLIDHVVLRHGDLVKPHYYSHSQTITKTIIKVFRWHFVAVIPPMLQKWNNSSEEQVVRTNPKTCLWYCTIHTIHCWILSWYVGRGWNLVWSVELFTTKALILLNAAEHFQKMSISPQWKHWWNVGFHQMHHYIYRNMISKLDSPPTLIGLRPNMGLSTNRAQVAGPFDTNSINP